MLVNWFIYSAAILLFATAAAKLVSSMGDARILSRPDPVLGFQFRHVFAVVGAVELAIVLFVLLTKRILLKIGLLAWLATGFALYRFGLMWIGYQQPCHCLGTLSDALHISPRMADIVMKIVFIYLLAGSYAALFWHYNRWKHGAPIKDVTYSENVKRPHPTQMTA